MSVQDLDISCYFNENVSKLVIAGDGICKGGKFRKYGLVNKFLLKYRADITYKVTLSSMIPHNKYHV